MRIAGGHEVQSLLTRTVENALERRFGKKPVIRWIMIGLKRCCESGGWNGSKFNNFVVQYGRAIRIRSPLEAGDPVADNGVLPASCKTLYCFAGAFEVKESAQEQNKPVAFA